MELTTNVVSIVCNLEDGRPHHSCTKENEVGERKELWITGNEDAEEEQDEEWWSSAESMTDGESTEDWWSSVDSLSVGDSDSDESDVNQVDDSDYDDQGRWFGLDLNALQIAVGRLLPGDKCVETTPYTSGRLHAVVELSLLSGNVIIGRIARDTFDFRAPNPPFPPFKEQSEIATMRYLRAHTSIPVAEVFVYDDDEGNIVGGTFCLQERLSGIGLDEAWPELTDAARKDVLRQMAAIQLQLFHLEFDTIGSLKEVSTSNGPVSFTVGPVVEMRDADVDDLVGPPPEPGPWSLPREWLATIVRGGLEYQPRQVDPQDIRQNRQAVALVTELARRLDNGVPSDGELAVCALRHPDFAFHNILVHAASDGSGARITGVLDWEGSQVVPRWALAGRLWFENATAAVAEALQDYYHDQLLRDPLFARAWEEGRKARALHRLCIRFGFAGASVEGAIEKFEAGEWGDDFMARLM